MNAQLEKRVTNLLDALRRTCHLSYEQIANRFDCEIWLFENGYDESDREFIDAMYNTALDLSRQEEQ